jgi:hypothetical protein
LLFSGIDQATNTIIPQEAMTATVLSPTAGKRKADMASVGDSVRKAISDWEMGDLEAAMLHACAAIDGTARKLHPNITSNKLRFTRTLRDNYSILGPMGLPMMNLVEQRWPVRVKNPTAEGGIPDTADVIYAVHRCCQAHGDELPDGFQLIKNAAGPSRITNIAIQRGKVAFSDRLIFGLLAVAVFSPVNIGQQVPEGHHLTFADYRLEIKDWWGAAASFPALAATEPIETHVIDFKDWTGLY